MFTVFYETLSGMGRFLRHRTLGRSIGLLLAGALALLLLVNLSTFVLIQRTAAFNEQVDSTWQLRRVARTVLLNLKDAETAQRGYLLTGQSTFLMAFNQSRDAGPRLVAGLDRRVGDDEPGQASVQALTRLSRDKFLEMTLIIDLARQSRSAEALAQVRAGRGKELMDQLDAEIAAMDSELGVRLSRQTAQSEGSALFTIVVNGIAALLIVLLGAVVLQMVRRYLQELRRARADVERVNSGLEEIVKARTSALVRANEEVQRFAYIVSHDLRSPLVNVMGYTAELEQAGKAIDLQMTKVETLAPGLVERDALTAAREDIPEAVGFIRASTEKMDRLITAILKLSREGRRDLMPEMLDPGAMAARIADSVRHQIEAGGSQFVVGDTVPFESDRLAMEQIFGNLIDNAVKYLDPRRPGRIEVSGRDLPDGWVEYAIADNGRGIAARDHERIFELFRRAGPQDRQGEGLGLAFVRNSVRRLGGTVEVESVLGQGSTFRLKFPKRLILDGTGDTV